jgi:hypothetical protein
MKRIIYGLLLFFVFKTSGQTPTVSALSTDIHVQKYFEHSGVLCHHMDTALLIADASNVTDSALHLQTRITNILSRLGSITPADKIDLAGTFFFADTAQLNAIVDSIKDNAEAVYTAYSNYTDVLPDSLAVTWTVLYPSNLPQNECLEDKIDCQKEAIKICVYEASHCTMTQCSNSQTTCKFGCWTGASFGQVLNNRLCENKYQRCMANGDAHP